MMSSALAPLFSLYEMYQFCKYIYQFLINLKWKFQLTLENAVLHTNPNIVDVAKYLV